MNGSLSDWRDPPIKSAHSDVGSGNLKKMEALSLANDYLTFVYRVKYKGLNYMKHSSVDNEMTLVEFS